MVLEIFIFLKISFDCQETLGNLDCNEYLNQNEMQLFSLLIFPSAVITYLISSPLRTWEYTVSESLISSRNITHTVFPSHGFWNHSVPPKYPRSCLLPKHDTPFDSCTQNHLAPAVGSSTFPACQWRVEIFHEGLKFLGFGLVFVFVVLKRFWSQLLGWGPARSFYLCSISLSLLPQSDFYPCHPFLSSLQELIT